MVWFAVTPGALHGAYVLCAQMNVLAYWPFRAFVRARCCWSRFRVSCHFCVYLFCQLDLFSPCNFRLFLQKKALTLSSCTGVFFSEYHESFPRGTPWPGEWLKWTKEQWSSHAILRSPTRKWSRTAAGGYVVRRRHGESLLFGEFYGLRRGWQLEWEIILSEQKSLTVMSSSANIGSLSCSALCGCSARISVRRTAARNQSQSFTSSTSMYEFLLQFVINFLHLLVTTANVFASAQYFFPN